MKLLRKAIADRLPPLYAYEGRPDEAIAHAKFFNPVDQLDLVRERVRSRSALRFAVVVASVLELADSAT